MAKIPDMLLYIDSLFAARYGYPCFDCGIKNNMDEFKHVIGFSNKPPRGSIRSCIPEEVIAIVYRCPICGKIFWLHCEEPTIRRYQRYKNKAIEAEANNA